MTRTPALVLQLQEYGEPRPVVAEIAAHLSCSPSRARDLIVRAGERVQAVLRLASPPFEFVGNMVRAIGIAGVIRVAPGIELEIVPKYLGVTSGSWREDLLFLAALTRHGDLLASDRIGTRRSTSDDFVTLLSRAAIRLFQDAQRRPLRAYQMLHVDEYALDGDVDSVAIVLTPEEGYPQTRMELTRRNPSNATILAGVRLLTHAVREPMLIRQLRMIESRLGQQGPPPRGRPRVPGRSRQWRPLVDLCWDLLKGATREYGGPFQAAPGFVIETWRVWEGLLGIALRLKGLQSGQVQRTYRLGARTVHPDGARPIQSSANVRPDFVLPSGVGGGKVIIDAKYKTNVSKRESHIQEADLYEALAFSSATGIEDVLLAYPQAVLGGGVAPVPTGVARLFEEIVVGSVRVRGVAVSVAGIGKSGGLKEFSDGIQSFLLSAGNGLSSGQSGGASQGAVRP